MLQLSGHQGHQVGWDRKLHGELEDPVMFGVGAARRTHQNRHSIWDLERKRKKKCFLLLPEPHYCKDV